LQRVVYAPEVFAYVYTSQGNYIDLTPDIISGTLTRKVNQPSTLKLVLQNTADPNDGLNPNRVYMGGQIIPMDRIVVYLKRDKPVQVFSGYIDLAPYWQPYPRPVQIEASCTLKRLEFTYWDPGLGQVIEILNSIGFLMTPAGPVVGYQQADPTLYAGRPNGLSNGENVSPVADTGFIALLRFLLEDVGQWNTNSVFIEPLPVGWVEKATAIFQQVIDDEDTLKTTLDTYFGSGGSPPQTGQTGVPVTEFKGTSTDFQNEMRQWISDYFINNGLVSNHIYANNDGSNIALQAYTSGKKKNVDPRLLVALAALKNFGLSGTHVGHYNLFGGTKNYGSWHQCMAEAALLLSKDTFLRNSIYDLINGGNKKPSWLERGPAQVSNKKFNSSIKVADSETVGENYRQLLILDQTGSNDNLIWSATTIHPSKFRFPTTPVTPRKKTPAKPAPPPKNAYVELHAVGEIPKDPSNYNGEEKDNLAIVGSLKTFINEHNTSWKMSAADIGKKFDTVQHQISIFIRHYPDIPANAKKISIAVSPHASANSLRLAQDIENGLTDRGITLTTKNFKRAPYHAYAGLTKERADAVVLITMPAKSHATGRPTNQSLVEGIANGIYQYKFKVLNPTLTENPTNSTNASPYGWRVFAKAYRTKIIPGDVSVAQTFRFKATVPFYAPTNGKIIYADRISGVGAELLASISGLSPGSIVGKKAIFMLLSPNASGIQDNQYIGFIGGNPESGVFHKNKVIKAGELLGHFTAKETAYIGFTAPDLASKGLFPYGSIDSPCVDALTMHNLLCSQMPDIPNNSNANRSWAVDTSVPIPTFGESPIGNTIGSGTGVAAFNVTLNVPIDQISSQLLTGYRSYENDIKLFDSVEQVVTSSMRVFSSLPDGSFIAWYPDYFNLSGQNPYYYINSNEIVDFTIDLNDAALVTHSYVIGAPYGPLTFSQTQTLEQIAGAGVASIDMPGIVDSFFNLETQGKDLSSPAPIFKNIDAVNNFFNRYGIRPQINTESSLRNPIIEFFYAYHLLMKSWAEQYISNISLTFLPELFPGMTAQIETNDSSNPAYCVYVEEVSHNFDYQNGFTTTAQVSSLSRPRVTDPTKTDDTDSFLPGAGSDLILGPAPDTNQPGLALSNNYTNGMQIGITSNANLNSSNNVSSIKLNPDGSLGSDTTQLLQTLGWNG
jgi:hypothetical protein